MEDSPCTKQRQEWREAIDNLAKAADAVRRLESAEPESHGKAHLAWHDELHKASLALLTAQRLYNKKWLAYSDCMVWDTSSGAKRL